MKLIKYIIAFLGFSSHALQAQLDSLDILDFETFAQWVVQHHPLSYGANLQLDLGNAELQAARGNFDPRLASTIYDKYFDNKTYYKQRSAGLNIPTWYGIEAKLNYEQNEGINLNPEAFTPNAGLISAGISVPLGKDLFIDKRRAALKKAKLYRESSIAERKNMLNDLLLNAGQAYWNWFSSYYVVGIYTEAWEAAKETHAKQLAAIRSSWFARFHLKLHP